MTTNNHPAHGPVSLDRLHQISEILSKAAAQSDGGNLGYAMADAVKVIDWAIAAFGAEPVPFDALRDAVAEVSGGSAMEWSDIYKGHQGVPFINFNSLARIVDKFRTSQPAPVVPTFDEWLEIRGNKPLGWVKDAMRESYDACRAAMLQSGNSPVTPDGSTCKYCGGTGYFRWQQSENMCPCPCVGCDQPTAPKPRSGRS
ncbi:TPA: hypothetical protein MX490_004639 [Citrobacter freundii]|nr:hypothetical protein [Citrobacter freundii]HCA7954042.1 hypothetical protein [Citrobacter freundii]